MKKVRNLFLLMILFLGAGEVYGRDLKRSADLPTDEEALTQLMQQIDAGRIGDFIQAMSQHPRNTQSEWMGEKEKDVKKMFKDFGMEVITKKYKVLQCFPKDVDPSLTEILKEDGSVHETFREDGDKEKKILPAFNAWAKSGTVVGEPVYANYGRKEDFEALEKKGIPLKDKIAIVRYGKIYRGDKSKFAKKFGCKGVIIYMDAADYAPEGVPTMPNGPGLPREGIQRGTLKDGLGDPSTYLYPSTKYAYHDSKEEYESRLPGIVVMPINYENALPLLQNMAGDVVDAEWQGGVGEDKPQYRYGPGFKAESADWKKLRITVNLEYREVEIENIFGVIRGQQEPDRWVMMGNHRDTWVHGSVDATTGLAALNEIGHGLSKLQQQGWKPRRTIVLASWGAEEQGIIGSTEFVEDYMTLLQEKMVAYINVDVAAADQETFNPAATPNFRPLLEKAAKQASAPLNEKYDTLYNQWNAITQKKYPELSAPKIKELGSGSDYAAFLNMAGVSCIDLTITGPYYTYHTEYDNYEYLSRHADPGMRGTKAVSEVAALIMFELITEKLTPLNALSYSNYVRTAISSSNLEADLKVKDIDYGILKKSLDKFVESAQKYEDSRSKYLGDKNRKHMELRRFNDMMIQMERSFIFPPGLPGRPQNRHILIAPSSLNAYSGSVFPGLFDSLTIAKESESDSSLSDLDKEKNWNQVKKQLTIAAWVTKAAARALSFDVFPN